MATSKKQSKTKSKAPKSKSATRAKAASKSTRGSNRVEMKATEEGFAQASYQKARSFIDQNANLPTAGLALAGAGILALVSTQKGRGLIKAGAEAVLSLVSLPAVTEAVTGVLPESIKSTFQQEKPVKSKTDFAAASKRSSAKQSSKSAKAQI